MGNDETKDRQLLGTFPKTAIQSEEGGLAIKIKDEGGVRVESHLRKVVAESSPEDPNMVDVYALA